MVDRSSKGSESEDSITSKIPEEKSVKSCADCGTTKTPLWRGGPAGPKSLCNACGIKSRKKRRAILGLNRGGVTEVDKKSKRSNNNFGDSLKRKLMEVVREMGSNKRSMVGKLKRWKKLGEEEQAAVLLMALSYGSVYA